MDTNKMREQFESWAWREYGQLLWWDMNYSEVFRRSGESYFNEFLSVRWEAWQASREALMVELTAEYELPPTMDMKALVTSIRQQDIATIEAQGLKVAP